MTYMYAVLYLYIDYIGGHLFNFYFAFFANYVQFLI